MLAVRLQALKSGDARRGVQGYYDLAAYARTRIRGTSDAEVKGMWKDRLRDLGVRVGNALVEMGDLEAGRRHFETLAEATTNSEEKTALSSWVAMLCLRMGDLEGARTWTHGDQEAGEVSTIDAPSPTTGQKHDVLKPLLNMAEGDYETAVTEWRSLLNGPHNVLAKQNLAVCLLYTGHLSQVHSSSFFSLSPPFSYQEPHLDHSHTDSYPSDLPAAGRTRQRKPRFLCPHLQPGNRVRALDR